MKTDVIFRNGKWLWYVISKKRHNNQGLLYVWAHGYSKDKTIAELRASNKLKELQQQGIK